MFLGLTPWIGLTPWMTPWMTPWKSERISDEEKLGHVRAELAALCEARDRSIFDGDGLAALVAELKLINESLWRTEHEIR